MHDARKASRVAGILYIAGMIAGILSVVYVIEQPNYLTELAKSEMQILVGAAFQLLMVPAYIGVALSLYPILRHHNERFALGFVGFRFTAGAFHLVGVVLLLLFLHLGREAVQADPQELAFLSLVGEMLRTARDLSNHVGMISAVSLGGLMYYSLLLQARLVPRWLSGWGLAASLLTILASALVVLNVVEIVSTGYMIMNVPMALNELVLAVWLIVKGLDLSASREKPELSVRPNGG